MLRTCIGGCAVAQLTLASLAIAVSAVPQSHEHGAEQECARRARRTPARTPARPLTLTDWRYAGSSPCWSRYACRT